MDSVPHGKDARIEVNADHATSAGSTAGPAREHAAPVIEVRHLTHRVQSGEATLTLLHDISLTIHAGERVAIVGASGSGKSTLLGLLAGLDTPSDGEILLLGKHLDQLDEDSRAALRRGRVGFVFQSFQLLPAFTALENVRLPLELARAAGEPITRREIDDRALAALRDVGLAARAHHLPAQLSGGEQQRVAVARAFIERPRILFADEPTGNLDRATGQRIVDLLFGDAKSDGTHIDSTPTSTAQAPETTPPRAALVLVTHDESLAARCDRIIRISDGHLHVETKNTLNEASTHRHDNQHGRDPRIQQSKRDRNAA
ncbi:MAG: ABC transporter ATP-binding protein [Thioalkalivibrionaceae bacterium]